MTLLAAAIAFVLVWSALVWGCATSGLNGREAYTDWPSYWRTQILVALLPVFFVFVYTLVPGTLKPDFGFLQLIPAHAAVVEPGLSTGDAATVFISQSLLVPTLVGFVIAIYAIGLIFSLVHFLYGKFRSGRITKAASFREGLGIWVTDRSIPPFAVGGVHPKIIFPENLLSELTPAQAQMVVRHEQAHLDHRDPLWAEVFYLVRAIFWFSPFVRDLINRWQVSVELRSDSVALAGQPPELRKAYAESLITALRMPAELAPSPSASFSNKQLRSEKMRIKNIMRGENGRSHGLQSNVQLLVAATALTLIGCTSAAGVSTAATDEKESLETKRVVRISADGDNSWVHKASDGVEEKHHKIMIEKNADGEMVKQHKIIMHKDGEVIERDYGDLTDAERAEIDRELARAEVEIERAMKEMDLAEGEHERADAEIKRVIKIRKGEDGELMTVDIEGELERAKVEIEIAREELREAHEELEEERARLADED